MKPCQPFVNHDGAQDADLRTEKSLNAVVGASSSSMVYETPLDVIPLSLRASAAHLPYLKAANVLLYLPYFTVVSDNSK